MVGEGDFSFARALALSLNLPSSSAHDGHSHSRSLLLATSLDTYAECIDKYGTIAQQNIELIREYHGIVLHGVDGRLLHCNPQIQQILSSSSSSASSNSKHSKSHKPHKSQSKCNFNFTRIIFNFPHLGGISIPDHQNLIREFLHSCKAIMNVENGQIHILLRDSVFFNKWQIEKIGRHQCNLDCQIIENFDINQFDDYKPVRTDPHLRSAPPAHKVKFYCFTMKTNSKNRKRKHRKWISSSSLTLPLPSPSKSTVMKVKAQSTVAKASAVAVAVHAPHRNRKRPNKKQNKQQHSQSHSRSKVRWTSDEKLKMNQLKTWGLKLAINHQKFKQRKKRSTLQTNRRMKMRSINHRNRNMKIQRKRRR